MDKIQVLFMVLAAFGLGITYGRFTYRKKVENEGKKFIETLMRNEKK